MCTSHCTLKYIIRHYDHIYMYECMYVRTYIHVQFFTCVLPVIFGEKSELKYYSTYACTFISLPEEASERKDGRLLYLGARKRENLCVCYVYDYGSSSEKFCIKCTPLVRRHLYMNTCLLFLFVSVYRIVSGSNGRSNGYCPFHQMHMYFVA